jgi:hypothetical protein
MRRFMLAAAVVLGSACAHSTTETVPKPDRSIISKEQLTSTHFASVYEAVAGLRSNWLQNRGPDSFNTPTQVKVYLDNSLLGGTETLKTISPSSISYVRYFDGISAVTRWGLDHGAGVIFVSTRPEKAPPR